MTTGANPATAPPMDRDLLGYGANPPNPNWPNPKGTGAARLAVNFVLNFEEGSEPSIGDGDPASEWGLTEYGTCLLYTSRVSYMPGASMSSSTQPNNQISWLPLIVILRLSLIHI